MAETKAYDKWILTKAYNLAATLTSYEKVFKVDSDVIIKDGFFVRHNLKPGTYYAGNWKKARNKNEQHLNGMLYLFRNDYFNVNGYNECIQSYGWDDDDFYIRLSKSNLKRIDLKLDYLYHIPHVMKMENQSNSHVINEDIELLKTRIEIIKNKIISSDIIYWNKSYHRDTYQLTGVDFNHINCILEKNDYSYLSSEKQIFAQRKAMKKVIDSLSAFLPLDVISFFEEDNKNLDLFYNAIFGDLSSDTIQLFVLLAAKINRNYVKYKPTLRDVLRTINLFFKN